MHKWAGMIFGILSLIFLGVIWWGAPNRELIWFMLPFGGLFRQIGGTWWKAVGRFLTPIMVLMGCIMFTGWTWWLLGVLAAILLVKTLPVTIGGSSITDSIWTRLWTFVLGAVNGLVAVPLAIPYDKLQVALFAALIPAFTYFIFINLSNMKLFRKVFVWKFVEFLMGASALVPICMVIERALS